MRCLLINRQEQIVHKFDAIDIPDARTQAQAYCMANQVSLGLAVLVRRMNYVAPPPAPTIDDQAA